MVGGGEKVHALWIDLSDGSRAVLVSLTHPGVDKLLFQ